MFRILSFALALVAGLGFFYLYDTPATATPTAEQTASPSSTLLTGWGPYTFGMSPVEVRLIAPTNLKTDDRGRMSYEVMIDGDPYIVQFVFMNNRLAVVWLNFSDETVIGESIVDEEVACTKRFDAIKVKMMDRYSKSTRLDTNGHYLKLHFPDASFIWTGGSYNTIDYCKIFVGYKWGDAVIVPSGNF